MWVVVAAACDGEGNQHYAPERREQHDAHHHQRNRYLPEQRWPESAESIGFQYKHHDLGQKAREQPQASPLGKPPDRQAASGGNPCANSQQQKADGPYSQKKT